MPFRVVLAGYTTFYVLKTFKLPEGLAIPVQTKARSLADQNARESNQT